MDQGEIIVGIDEAGRGPLFGRGYASAVILSDDFDTTILKDSKKFTSFKKIYSVYEEIKNKSKYYSVNYADESEIDEINILQATQRAMHKCVKDIIQQIIDNEDIESISKLRLKVDGNYFNDYTQFMNDEITVIPHECVIKGDDKVKAISAASILAKVDRDLYIENICKTHPDLDEKYDLVKNKGYGTKKHRDGIQQYGYSEFHRKSFKLKSLNVPRN